MIYTEESDFDVVIENAAMDRECSVFNIEEVVMNRNYINTKDDSDDDSEFDAISDGGYSSGCGYVSDVDFSDVDFSDE